jgi:hypothetical protein
VLAEAVRNAHKHARPSRVEVTLGMTDGTLTLEIANDGVSGPAAANRHGPALAALEALQVGGIVEFGERERARGECGWRSRLTAPDVNPGRLATGGGSSERRLRVLIVDDHEVVHWGFRLMLGEQPWVERCVSARNAARRWR